MELSTLLRGVAEATRLRGFARFDFAFVAAPLTVRASSERLTRAFENLIDNAVSFSPPSGRIELRLDRDGDDAVVRVNDEGPGIPEAHLARIFDRFFCYRPERPERARDHTGLGLAIARAIVESAGGRVRAENRAGGGASFELRLPLELPARQRT